MNIWMACSVLGLFISAIVAMGKNRNVIGWGLLGFFLPLIGVIAACIAEPLKKADSGTAS